MLTIFANLIPIEDALKVLDRFILGNHLFNLNFLDGEKAVLDIMKHLLKNQEEGILEMDCWDIQVYLGRKMYEESIEEGNFFPR